MPPHTPSRTTRLKGLPKPYAQKAAQVCTPLPTSRSSWCKRGMPASRSATPPSRRSAARLPPYRPIDLGASGHPPLRLAPARLQIGVDEVIGEPVREDLLRVVQRNVDHRCAER